MNLWDCIEILQKPEKGKLFGNQKLLNKKIAALHRLSEIGHPSIIYQLIPYLQHSSKQLSSAVLKTTQKLFVKLKGKKAYYASLKYCPITKEDIEYYRANFTPKECLLLLKISSLNGNGYVREQAVRLLGDSGEAEVLPFLIFRLADWVPEIRVSANQELEKFFLPHFLRDLLANLSLFHFLQKVERINLLASYQRLISFATVNHRLRTLEIFPTIKDKERRLLAYEISLTLSSAHEINLLVNDKHFLIRLLALDHFDRSNEEQRLRLLQDRSARVRQSALLCYKGSELFEKLLKGFVADTSGNIRQMARFYLKEQGIDFRQLYLQNLSRKQAIIGSLLGLLDLRAEDCADRIEAFLKSEKIREVKTAFFVLSNLQPASVDVFAREKLFTSQPGLQNLIIAHWAKRPNREIIAMAREKYMEADLKLKLAILKLFSLRGGYSIFPDLMIATVAPEEAVRKQAAVYLQKWQTEAISIFRAPTDEQKAKAAEVHARAHAIHEQQGFFLSNPLQGLELYLR